jgi:hypothetical protein
MGMRGLLDLGLGWIYRRDGEWFVGLFVFFSCICFGVSA